MERVYFIQGETSGSIKIGTTGNLAARLTTMKTASAEPLILLGHVPGGRELESALHAEFASLRQRGEWFRSAPELISRIAALCTEIEIARDFIVSVDPHTLLALRMLTMLERETIEQAGCTRKQARLAIAEVLGFTPGFLENLQRGRIAAISARDYEKIRIAAVDSGERQLLTAKDALAELKERWGM